MFVTFDDIFLRIFKGVGVWWVGGGWHDFDAQILLFTKSHAFFPLVNAEEFKTTSLISFLKIIIEAYTYLKSFQ